MRLPAAAVILLLVSPLAAEDADVVKLAPFRVEEPALDLELGRWSYARAGQCEVMTDHGPLVAAAIVRDAVVVAEYLRYAHPEADIPKRTPIRIVVDSGTPKSLFRAGAARPGGSARRGAVGLHLVSPLSPQAPLAEIRRELVRSGFAHNGSKLPFWYQRALSHLIAAAKVTDNLLVIGHPPAGLKPRTLSPAERAGELAALFQLREDSPELRDETRRRRYEELATLFMQVCLYSHRGVHARSFLNFLLDPAVTADPPTAFTRAFGAGYAWVDPLLREAARRDYRYFTTTVRCQVDTEPATRPGHRSDLDDFTYALGAE